MSFHNTYRPRTLKSVIGHENAVAALKGYVSSGEYPNAVFFLGPPSAGKSTLAMAFAREVLGGPLEGNKYFSKFDLSANRTMDDIQGIKSIARLRIGPEVPRRIIYMEEFQGILGSPGAGNSLLDVLETPPPQTLFILMSMETEKFSSTKLGQGLLTRCTKFELKPPTKENLIKQAKRIITREEMTYLPEGAVEKLASTPGQTYRDLANALETAAGIYNGLRKKPEVLSDDQIDSVILQTSDKDDELAAQMILALYNKDYKAALNFALQSTNQVTFLMKVCNNCQFAVNTAVLGGKRPPRAWVSKYTHLMVKKLSSSEKETDLIRGLSRINALLINMKLQAGAFAVDELQALSAAMYTICYED